MVKMSKTRFAHFGIEAVYEIFFLFRVVNRGEVSHLLGGVAAGRGDSKCSKLRFENLKNFSKFFFLEIFETFCSKCHGTSSKTCPIIFFHFSLHAHQVLSDDMARKKLFQDLLKLISEDFTQEKLVFCTFDNS